ncbi:hypothetical protein [Rhodopirellula bahusiensis]|uniref:hypothetical protein n=1 Tax=Rhodopirellula bahusiensis TaxID=2014065 RepID=UPI0032645157
MISSSTLDHPMDQQFPGNKLPRRAFVRLTAVTGGLAVAGRLTRSTHADDAVSNTSDNLERSYLEAGLNALARAHHMSSMAGHLGASMIAGYYIARQRPDLDPAIEAGIQDDLRRVRGGESVFGQRMSRASKLTDAELFEPVAKQKADAKLIDGIAEGLQKSIDKPRQSAHNVIFASLAIRVLQDHPEYAAPSVVDGIMKLMKLYPRQPPVFACHLLLKSFIQDSDDI